MCLTHEDLVVSWGGICCGKNLWHVCDLFSNVCTCTCICGLFLRLQLRLHLRLHWVCTGLHVSAGFHCVCTCVAFVFTPALHLRLQWCCHAASVAMVLHLGCTCVCMLRPIRVSEGDVEESALALAPACCGVSLWFLPAVASLGTTSSRVALL